MNHQPDSNSTFETTTLEDAIKHHHLSWGNKWWCTVKFKTSSKSDCLQNRLWVLYHAFAFMPRNVSWDLLVWNPGMSHEKSWGALRCLVICFMGMHRCVVFQEKLVKDHLFKYNHKFDSFRIILIIFIPKLIACFLGDSDWVSRKVENYLSNIIFPTLFSRLWKLYFLCSV